MVSAILNESDLEISEDIVESIVDKVVNTIFIAMWTISIVILCRC